MIHGYKGGYITSVTEIIHKYEKVQHLCHN